jgi:hypothetical protein
MKEELIVRAVDRELVDIGDGVRVPRIVDLEVTQAREPTLRVRLEIREGVPSVRQLCFIAREQDGTEVVGRHLRDLRLEDRVEQALNRVAVVNDEGQAGSLVTSMDSALAEARAELRRQAEVIHRVVRDARRNGRRRFTDEHLADVARVHAADTTGAPVRAVAEHFGVARRTAMLYVKKARDAGLIENGGD